MINTGVVMPAANQSKLVEKQCLEAGLEKDRDFILSGAVPDVRL
jgi:hypothetical protein